MLKRLRLARLSMLAGCIAVSVSVSPVSAYADGAAPSSAAPASSTNPAIATPGLIVNNGRAARALLASAPSSAAAVAQALGQALDTHEAMLEADRRLQTSRAEYDRVRTELVRISEEVESLTAHQRELTQQRQEIERQRQDRLTAIQKDSEARLHDELDATRQQLSKRQDQDRTHDVAIFEANERVMLEKQLSQDLQLKEGEVAQLREEIDAQTKELVNRLGQLEQQAQTAKTVQQSVSQAVERQNAELQQARKQVNAQRDELLQRRVADYSARLKTQQNADLEAQLRIKEAGLRQAMAEVLHKTNEQFITLLEPIDQQLATVTKRVAQLAELQQSLTLRVQGLAKDVSGAEASSTQTHTQFKAQGQAVGQALGRVPIDNSQSVLDWFRDLIDALPADMTEDMASLHQRMLAQLEHDRRVVAQQKMLRERQLAVQVSREVERQYEQMQQQHKQEALERQRRIAGLLSKADQLSSQGRFDEALQLVAQAQAANPPDPEQVLSLRQHILSARTMAAQRDRSDQIEKSFSQAMDAFNQGQYEKAIHLFEQVVGQDQAAKNPGGGS